MAALAKVWRSAIAACAGERLEMKAKLFWAIAIALMLTPAAAQDWQSGSMGNVEYNCDAVMGAVTEFGLLYYIIRGTDTLTPGDGDAEHYILTDVNAITVAESLLGRASGCGTALVKDDEVVDIYEPDRWKLNITRDYLYQCDVVREIVASYGDLEFRRDGDRRHTVIVFYQEDAPDCVPRYVIAKNDTEVLECAESSCESLGSVSRGSALPVIGLRKDWYEVALGEETGFIAEAMVMPGPLALLHVDEKHVMQYADCVFAPQQRPAKRRFIAIIKAGLAYQEMEVSLYPPLSDTALTILEERDREFSGSGNPYILQLYPPVDFSPGIYIIELTLNELTFRFGFDASEDDLYHIHIYCY